MARAPGLLFDPDVPDGFQYRSSFITADEEAGLVQNIAGVAFSTFEMRGIVARRRVAFFGRSYAAAAPPALPMPGFLMPLRDAVSRWVQVDPAVFVMALINEYPAGAPIGWHRDAPQYGIVVGISLLSVCRMKFRPYVSPSVRDGGNMPRRTSHEVVLEPRSAYLLSGEARSAYEHHIPAVSALRYSITFRTMRT